jgi:hypothetical protein
MEYNVNSSLLAGHGFWGDLSLMTEAQRMYVGQQVRQSKRVLPYITETEPIIIGRVGESPEIYSIINGEKGAGQIISFSEEPSNFSFQQELNTSAMLAVLNNPFEAAENLLRMDLNFDKKEATSAVFVLPNGGSGISIISSTVALTDAQSDGKQLSYQVDGAGNQMISWPLKLGEPIIKDRESLGINMRKEENGILLEIQVRKDKKTTIQIESN